MHVLLYSFQGDLTHEDFHMCLGFSIYGSSAHLFLTNFELSWALINLTLYNSNLNFHEPTINSLSPEARVVQHIFQNNVILKAGDCFTLLHSFLLLPILS